MRGPAWCLGAGLVMGLLVAGALGGVPYSAIRVSLTAAVAVILAWVVVARTFDDGSSSRTSRYLAALIGALVLPAISLGAD